MSTRPPPQAEHSTSGQNRTPATVPLKFRTALASQLDQKKSPRTPAITRTSRLVVRRAHAGDNASNGQAAAETPNRSRFFGKRGLDAKEVDLESPQVETLPQKEVRAVWDRFLALGMPIRELNLTFEDVLTLASVPVVARVRSSIRQPQKQPWKAAGALNSAASSSSSSRLPSIPRSVSFACPSEPFPTQALVSDPGTAGDEPETARGSASKMQTFGHLLVEMKRLLVGRMEAARVRGRLHLERDLHSEDCDSGKDQDNEGMKSSISREETVYMHSEVLLQEATARLESTNRIVTAVKQESALLKQRSSDLEQNRRKLMALLDKRRRAQILLNVLHDRESIRMQRLSGKGIREEIDALVEVTLRRTEISAMLQEVTAVGPTISINQGWVNGAPGKRNNAFGFSHTTQVMASLHGLHVRVKRQNSSAPTKKNQKELNSRLDEQLRRYEFDGEEAIRARIYALAAGRAEQRTRYILPDLKTGAVTNEDLDHRANLIRERQREIRELVNQMAALQSENASYISHLKEYASSIGAAQLRVLHEERRRLLGYVDTLAGVILQKGNAVEASSFTKEVCLVLGHQDRGPSFVISDLERRLGQLVESQKLRALVMLATPRGENRIEGRMIGLEGSWKRLEDVLSRKSAKALHGFSTAEEIAKTIRLVKSL